MRIQTLWEARWIFAALVVTTGGFWALQFWLTLWPSILGLGLIFYVIYFFRDPDRTSPDDPNAVVAAADGIVTDIKVMDEQEVTKTSMKRVGIFLSVLDVHTNRAPIKGQVIYSKEYAGTCLDARDPESSNKNAFRTWGFQNEQVTVVVRQLTGLIARRIVGWAKVGDLLGKGERFGMIRFGSRTEVYVPLDAEIITRVGNHVKGGITILARLANNQTIGT